MTSEYDKTRPDSRADPGVEEVEPPTVAIPRPGPAPPGAGYRGPTQPPGVPAQPWPVPSGPAPPAPGLPGLPPRSGPQGPGPQPMPAAPYLPGPVPPGVAATPVAGRRSRGWPGIAALVLAVILLPVVGVQAFWISTLQDRLAQADTRMSAGQDADQSRLDTL